MSNYHGYPKVWAFGHPNTKALIGRECWVEEKVDGSQISFGVLDEELVIRSRNADVSPYAPHDLFAPAVQTIVKAHEAGLLLPDHVYRGEAFKSAKHNTLEYGRVPFGNIVLFDVTLPDGWTYVDRDFVRQEADNIGCEAVPVLGTVSILRPGDVDALLTTPSFLGKVKVEGVVLKPVETVYGDDSKPVYAKVVSEAFKELHRHNPEFTQAKKGDVLQHIASTVSTLPRWRKTVQRLRDDGKLEGDPRDLRYLIQELQNDIVAECEEEIGKILFKHYRKKILGACVKGFAEWYKQTLVDEVFK